MTRSVEKKVTALVARAVAEGKKSEPSSSRRRSSLHSIIKTKDQAMIFMKMLKSL